MADLVIEALTAPESVESGRGITIGFTIRNVGQAASGPFAYSYEGPEGGGTSTYALGLLPGQAIADQQGLGDADYVAEVVTVRVVADSRDEVAESEETNNEASEQVEVICTDPDLCP